MSGPKRADVEAQLNVARNSQRTCANLISAAQDAAIAGILRDVEGILREADSISGRLRDETGNFSRDMRRIAPDGIRTIDDAASGGNSALNSARDGLNRARGEVDQARRQEETARNTFNNAEREYERARSALRGKSGDHYMEAEMALARQATTHYDQAARELNIAAQSRKRAENAASESLQRAREARGNLDGALRQVVNVRSEAQSLLKAEEEARKIAEEKRRNATVALDKAKAAVQRVGGLPHTKFSPGGLDAVSRELDSAVRMLDDGHCDEARGAADQVVTSAARLEKDVTAALQEFERNKAAAESQLEVLQATQAGIDESLIRDWSSRSGACDDARQAIEQARRAIAEERFAQAEEGARSARQMLTDAMQSAAEAKSADERRTHIGNAIMEVLDELHFDVSFDAGNRDEPLRITGQTPDDAGKGDFDIAIPLSGEVDFRVESPQGDVSCVGAVNELQKRLAERGVKWNTTDWGHAEGVKITETKSTSTVNEQIQVKSKG